MIAENKQRFIDPYLRVITSVGAVILLFSACRLPAAILDTRFLVLVILTIICSRATIQIPRFKSHFSFTDTLIFLTLLLFGGEAAILLAAAEGFSSSLRFCKRTISVLSNTAIMAISTFVTVWTLRLCFGEALTVTHNDYSATLIALLCAMALVQFVTNSTLAAIYGALKSNQTYWHTWTTSYLWTSVTYFAGASAAGVIVKLIESVGFYAFVIATPVIAIVYFTYRMYSKNVETSIAQAEESDRHAAAMQESEERFRSSFEYAAIGMALVSPEGRWLKVSPSMREIVGYSDQELLITDFQTLTHPADLAAANTMFYELVGGKPTCHMEKRYHRKGGREVWVLWSASTVRAADGHLLHLIFQIQDITDRKRAEQQLLHEAFHDTLTGLPNRALFIDRLKLTFERARRRDDLLFAVLFLDFDRFKIVNDSLGHAVGDQLLEGIARRLETCMRGRDTVARLGGDEFTVLLEDITSIDDAVRVAERINQEMALPFNLLGHEVFTSASIGIALSAGSYERADDVLRDADAAMYQAKALGKARYVIFTEDMRSHAEEALHLETDLRWAVERQEFVLHYQPIVSLEAGRISGFEALVRWQHPQHGLIPPAEFIPQAEEMGLIIPIGQWVLREACDQARRWQERFPTYPPMTISVNISGKQLAQPNSIEQVKGVLEETGLDPHNLILEITESVLMKDEETTIDILRQLRGLGVRLSIDDFGTGYSSLSYLNRFSVNALKIDRSFVSRMADNNESVVIVRTIVMLAQNLGMDVVAEGAETEGQVAQLKALGCEYGQGYFFSRPLATEAASQLLLGEVASALPFPSAGRAKLFSVGLAA